MPAEDFIKDIQAKKLKAVQDRLKKENIKGQKYVDPKNKAIFYTPLHAAVKADEPQIVDALLAGGADVTAVDNENATPLHWCCTSYGKNATAIAESLLKKKAKVDAVTKANLTPLHLAAKSGNAAIVPVLAKAGAPVEFDAPGVTPVHLAVDGGHWAAVDALVAAGAKLGVQDASGCTPLMKLAKAGKYAEARQLLDKGDNALDTQDKEKGHSALMMAVMSVDSPDAQLVAALLDKGASPDLQDTTSKDTPIMAAIAKKQVAVAKLLIKASKKINARNAKKECVLSLAVAADSDELVVAALAAGADTATDGPVLMKSAMEKKKDALAAELIKVLKPTQVNALDLSFKVLAAQGMPLAALAYLKRFDEEQDDKHPVDNEGNTNLHVAAEAGAPYDLCVALMKMGLGPNTGNKAGDTPLHVAARAGHVEACRALLDGGADPLKRNGKSRKPRDQPKIPDVTRDFLLDAEEHAKERKAQKQSALWDDKMKATQTESAFGLRVV